MEAGDCFCFSCYSTTSARGIRDNVHFSLYTGHVLQDTLCMQIQIVCLLHLELDLTKKCRKMFVSFDCRSTDMLRNWRIETGQLFVLSLPLMILFAGTHIRFGYCFPTRKVTTEDQFSCLVGNFTMKFLLTSSNCNQERLPWYPCEKDLKCCSVDMTYHNICRCFLVVSGCCRTLRAAIWNILRHL